MHNFSAVAGTIVVDSNGCTMNNDFVVVPFLLSYRAVGCFKYVFLGFTIDAFFAHAMQAMYWARNCFPRLALSSCIKFDERKDGLVDGVGVGNNKSNHIPASLITATAHITCTILDYHTFNVGPMI